MSHFPSEIKNTKILQTSYNQNGFLACLPNFRPKDALRSTKQHGHCWESGNQSLEGVMVSW